MNIHRKDRAKLREISIDTSDHTKKSVSPSDHIHSPSSTDELILQQDISSDDMSNPSKRPCVTFEQQQQQHHQHISKEEDENHELIIGGDILQLPLFVDSPSKDEINKDMQLSVDDSKLDLELRLGPEP
ncbi:hypothetical protein MTR67_037701 [Solanum verrucosum]|uniref:Uncharacterized protein n=2 Tax=Solanum TaxID=4107 RepID=A0AAF0UET3_SOLVR|nr:hypothetical protein MTR67_037701 [Solanum verrucosum]